MLRTASWFCVVSAFSLVSAQAGVIYDNGVGPSDISSGYTSDFDGGQQLADDFTLQPGQNTIRDVHWLGNWSTTIDPSTVTDDFSIRFFADIGGSPNSTILHDYYVGNVVKSDTGSTFNGKAIYSYAAAIPDTVLTDSQTWWISIVNDSVSVSGSWAWVGDLTSIVGTTAHRSLDGNSWSTNSSSGLAFQLTDDAAPPVPEPSTIALILIGALGLTGYQLQRRR